MLTVSCLKFERMTKSPSGSPKNKELNQLNLSSALYGLPLRNKNSQREFKSIKTKKSNFESLCTKRRFNSFPDPLGWRHRIIGPIFRQNIENISYTVTTLMTS